MTALLLLVLFITRGVTSLAIIGAAVLADLVMLIIVLMSILS